MPTASKLPRWRGFNLLGMFWPGPNAEGRFRETDFDLVAEWGFDFVRLPLSYWFWARPESPLDVDHDALRPIDEAINLGRQRGIHVNINFHRIPGFCVGEPKEPASLWTDPSMVEAACFHWQTFARRYRGIPNDQLTFDLINEPAGVDPDSYVRVHRQIINAIRAVDPDRLIITDGINYGHDAVPSMAALGVAMSTRMYHPFRLTHYKAHWIKGADAWPEPTWPNVERHGSGTVTWDREALRNQRIAQWKQMEAAGVGVHVGEWGSYNRTPHHVSLAWMRDCLDLMREAGWGWALWNLRGSFGVLDSERADVQYEDSHGHKLDRQMLELLREF